MFDLTQGSGLPPLPPALSDGGPDPQRCSLCGREVELAELAYIVFQEPEDIYICDRPGCADSDWDHLLR